MNRKYLLLFMKKHDAISRKLLIILFITSSIYITNCKIAAGSYPYAERFEVDSPELEVIEAIKKIKKIYPQIVVPESIGISDGKSNSPNDHWYSVYFYNSEKSEIYFCWTRPITNKKTTIAFVSVKRGNGKWRDINYDFDDELNKEYLEYFKINFLYPIKALLK